MVPHQTRTKRRIITINELSAYFDVHRNTMRGHIKRYGKLDMRDIYSILNFTHWVERKNMFIPIKRAGVIRDFETKEVVGRQSWGIGINYWQKGPFIDFVPYNNVLEKNPQYCMVLLDNETKDYWAIKVGDIHLYSKFLRKQLPPENKKTAKQIEEVFTIAATRGLKKEDLDRLDKLK